ncbi:hypothetical protein H7T88_09940 [Paenibacillus cucumis Kampfer et al. 2016]|uniref:Uncharacterized protein n=1 Tax=Paenibacillus cucumis (ex Kampfer et al. 2016) TaxID=1776858 RepID=A0ABS7KHG4_9BACL|nr:hypothetical protein [Paenibacillus cucumis (ex Kampfer et al. 2016)]
MHGEVEVAGAISKLKKALGAAVEISRKVYPPKFTGRSFIGPVSWGCSRKVQNCHRSIRIFF